MNLADIGYTVFLEKSEFQSLPEGLQTGRVAAEHKERYIVLTSEGEYEAEITGNMRFSAESRMDFPAVGDWVLLTAYANDFAVIHKILPRYSILERKAAGNSSEAQIIATNVDYAFLIQSVDRDFNVNRIERYLTLCYSSGISPVVVLTKIDLIDAATLASIKCSVEKRIINVPVVTVSNITKEGLNDLEKLIEKGKTCCLLGSSGAGKSTLINNLAGKDIMRTDVVSESTNKGRHVTTHRELIVLDKGGVLIDNPGMREVGITDMSTGLEKTFELIYELSTDCKFKDCTHTNEPGCAVLKAVGSGQIDKALYKNFLKLEKEKNYYEMSALEKRQKDKNFGKMIKNFKKEIKKKK
ncbi:ribosome-associated GTPase [Melioribacter roseus P3M-2]|jgi:ribosome biogenesis GTPase|uniref:Small ribosomal subunit biogenesis GTPase RsgA n=1 Tax=Melioribacter roseus (strain DSM 23840 / JCM 17771 / VKM B-2668 / P3M-2) TaxID=1191523 RepID=I6ZRD7_MELRP|nr:ribosome small subunit-dependent GTPase A [Melioribacter roseus]AFN74634.1 ribosome-associated GTPase [Melioribacter roseus P3M-2]